MATLTATVKEKLMPTDDTEADLNMSPVKLRGFAAMTPERRLEIARKGGLAMPSHKRSFSKNNQLAVEAGRKGGSNRKKTNATSN